MTSSDSTLATEIETATGINPATCYQCGKCSAGCPMASESDLRPHQVMRRVMYGSRERALQDESVWLCLTCETCSARCPNSCDPARVIDAVREIAIESNMARIPRSLAAFHKAFLEQIRTNGRLHEMGLIMDYKLKTGDLLGDVANAPGMLARGKLPLRASKIDGVEEIKRIFLQCGVKP